MRLCCCEKTNNGDVTNALTTERQQNKLTKQHIHLEIKVILQ